MRGRDVSILFILRVALEVRRGGVVGAPHFDPVALRLVESKPDPSSASSQLVDITPYVMPPKPRRKSACVVYATICGVMSRSSCVLANQKPTKARKAPPTGSAANGTTRASMRSDTACGITPAVGSSGVSSASVSELWNASRGVGAEPPALFRIASSARRPRASAATASAAASASPKPWRAPRRRVGLPLRPKPLRVFGGEADDARRRSAPPRRRSQRQRGGEEGDDHQAFIANLRRARGAR